MPTLMLHSSTQDMTGLKRLFEKIAPELRCAVWPDVDPADVDAVACWRPAAGVLAGLPNLKLLIGTAAGVDNILADPTLPPGVPLTRIVDPYLAHGMAEYVIWGVLHFYRRFDAILNGRPRREWKDPGQQSAARTKIGIMGTGEIGGHVARELVKLGFSVSGWSRGARAIDGVTMFAGDEGLPGFLAELDICVCVLPLTPQTTRILGERTFAMMKPGAAIINVGRGPHVDADALLRSVRDGHLRGAILDVFDVEPLPDDSPLWQEPRIVITPHMASSVHPSDMVRQIAENVRRVRAGEPLLNLVDRARGY
ncbi:MAG: glyoxylate/hydroxypyruvate reductase A [Burkholderiaceae bacterium]